LLLIDFYSGDEPKLFHWNDHWLFNQPKHNFATSSSSLSYLSNGSSNQF